MKLSHFTLTTTALPSVLANFWMVYQRRSEQIGRVEFTSYGTSFVRDEPNWTCEDDAFRHRVVPDQQDASGLNYGVQFDPWSSRGGPLWHDPLVALKMNLYPSALGLQSKSIRPLKFPELCGRTISHEHDYAMTNVNNDLSGQCYLNRTFIFDLDCWFSHPDARVEQLHVSINGSSMFFYETDIEVEDIFAYSKSLQVTDTAILPRSVPAASVASY
ncbi:hypothetical protein F5Y03DRAFT_393783 [Xylaria venustula]|nr:hypothetical protein F5Y03DRAFT_393783 [Xylaria venustula]